MDDYELAAMMDALGDDRRDFIASQDEGGRRRNFQEEQQAFAHDEQRRANLRTQKGGFAKSLAAWYDEDNFEKDGAAEERAQKLSGQNGQSHRAGLNAMMRHKEESNQTRGFGHRPPFADNYGYGPRHGRASPSNMGTMPRQGPAARHTYHGPPPPQRRPPSSNAAPDPRSQGTVRIRGGKVVQGSFAQSDAQFAKLLTQGDSQSQPAPQTVSYAAAASSSAPQPTGSSMGVPTGPIRLQPPSRLSNNATPTGSATTRPPPGYNGQAMRSGVQPPPGFENRAVSAGEPPLCPLPGFENQARKALGMPRVPPGSENDPPTDRNRFQTAANALLARTQEPVNTHAPPELANMMPTGRPARPLSPFTASDASSPSKKSLRKMAKDNDPNREYTENELRAFALKWAANPGQERDVVMQRFPSRLVLLDQAREKLILQAINHLSPSADPEVVAQYYHTHEGRRGVLKKTKGALHVVREGSSRALEQFINGHPEAKYYVDVVRKWFAAEGEATRATEAKDSPLKSASRNAMAESGASRRFASPIESLAGLSAAKKLKTGEESQAPKTLLTASITPPAVQASILPEPAVHMATSRQVNTPEEPGMGLVDTAGKIFRIPVEGLRKLLAMSTDVTELLQSMKKLDAEMYERSSDRVGNAKRGGDGVWTMEEVVEIGVQA